MKIHLVLLSYAVAVLIGVSSAQRNDYYDQGGDYGGDDYAGDNLYADYAANKQAAGYVCRMILTKRAYFY